MQINVREICLSILISALVVGCGDKPKVDEKEVLGREAELKALRGVCDVVPTLAEIKKHGDASCDSKKRKELGLPANPKP
jgi:hypothetical protein